MVSEAQKKASKKYHQKNQVNITLSLNRATNEELIEFVDKIENKSAYLKELVIKDMKEKGEY